MLDTVHGVNNCLENPSEKHCTGCGACVAGCKFNAVHIDCDEYGFLVPAIDKNLCKNCGNCKRSCYKFEAELQEGDLSLGNVLAAWSNSVEVKKHSSSGGIAHEIAVHAHQNGYEVWGVMYDYNRNRACHFAAHTVEELQLFQGSKYIQSDTGALMEAVKTNQISKKALIFGTPCQIYALRKLQGDREWILVDIFCSGVPSYLLWDKYLAHISDKYHIAKVDCVKFRDKSYPWHDCYMSISDKENHVYGNSARDDLFYSFFLSKDFFRDSCFDCLFKLGTTYADIRIGDFWGKRFYGNDSGVSMVIINSEAGRFVLGELIKNNTISVEDAVFEEVLEAQHAINKKRTPKVDLMRRMLTEKSINRVYWKYLAHPLPKVVAKKIYHSLPAPMYRILKKLRGYN